jgi:hypothetical protein
MNVIGTRSSVFRSQNDGRQVQASQNFQKEQTDRAVIEVLKWTDRPKPSRGKDAQEDLPIAQT